MHEYVNPHQNVVKAFVFDILDNRPYIILEYVPIPGENTLENYIHNEISLEQSLKWALEFCQGMEHVLKCGVKSHRDIKTRI